MQLMHEQLAFSGNNSIKVKRDEFSYFIFPWHYHSELEIVYVLESYGTRYIGDSVEPFKNGDLVLLGGNLPHYWKNHIDFHRDDPSFKVKAIVVQFPEAIVENNCNHFSEFSNIRELVKRSERGIQFFEPAVTQIGEKLKSLLDLTGLDRYIGLLKTLELMATTTHYKLIGSPAIKKTLPIGIDHRLEKILIYLNNNFTEDHKLKDLSTQIGMNETAFCRFFKAGTSKTIVEYIHDLRIGHACKLLMQNNKNISEIAFECGFNNISNFNRIFKRKTKHTPSSYLKVMVELLN